MPTDQIPDEQAEHARRVRAARAWADLSQAELAERMGVALATVKRTEAGKRMVPWEELLTIGEVCSVPAWFMLRGMAEDDQNRAITNLFEQMAQAFGRLNTQFDAIAKALGPAP